VYHHIQLSKLSEDTKPKTGRGVENHLGIFGEVLNLMLLSGEHSAKTDQILCRVSLLVGDPRKLFKRVRLIYT
jgi:hypothetical protein